MGLTTEEECQRKEDGDRKMKKRGMSSGAHH